MVSDCCNPLNWWTLMLKTKKFFTSQSDVGAWWDRMVSVIDQQSPLWSPNPASFWQSICKQCYVFRVPLIEILVQMTDLEFGNQPLEINEIVRFSNARTCLQCQPTTLKYNIKDMQDCIVYKPYLPHLQVLLYVVKRFFGWEKGIVPLLSLILGIQETCLWWREQKVARTPWSASVITVHTDGWQ